MLAAYRLSIGSGRVGCVGLAEYRFGSGAQGHAEGEEVGEEGGRGHQAGQAGRSHEGADQGDHERGLVFCSGLRKGRIMER